MSTQSTVSCYFFICLLPCVCVCVFCSVLLCKELHGFCVVFQGRRSVYVCGVCRLFLAHLDKWSNDQKVPSIVTHLFSIRPQFVQSASSPSISLFDSSHYSSAHKCPIHFNILNFWENMDLFVVKPDIHSKYFFSFSSSCI